MLYILTLSSIRICRGFRAATINAVMAATKRSMQMGDIPEDDIRHKYNL
jgi:hypothetical protein